MSSRRPSAEPTVQQLLWGYAQGAFPMADPAEGGRVYWVLPELRAILPLAGGGMHISRSLARRIRSGFFGLSADLAFESVIRACAEPRRGEGEESRWLSEDIIRWLVRLHESGHAHSIECWRRDEEGHEHLVGGVYGVSIGAAFMAESMFCRPMGRQPDGSRHPLDGTDASKVALATLVDHIRRCGYELLDVQIINDHTERLGAREIPQNEYLRRLAAAVRAPSAWRPLSP